MLEKMLSRVESTNSSIMVFKINILIINYLVELYSTPIKQLNYQVSQMPVALNQQKRIHYLVTQYRILEMIVNACLSLLEERNHCQNLWLI